MSKLYINGDSNAYAIRPGVTLAQSWAQRVADARGHTLINCAVPGDTTAQMKAHMAADLALQQPEAVGIMMSANDSYHGVSVAQGRQNMIDMIDMGQQSGARVTIMMHHPFFHDGGTWLHTGAAKPTLAFMEELGGLPGVQYYNGFTETTLYLYYKGYNGGLASSSNPIIKPLYALDGNGAEDWIHFSAIGQNIHVDGMLKNPRACA